MGNAIDSNYIISKSELRYNSKGEVIRNEAGENVRFFSDKKQLNKLIDKIVDMAFSGDKTIKDDIKKLKNSNISYDNAMEILASYQMYMEGANAGKVNPKALQDLKNKLAEVANDPEGLKKVSQKTEENSVDKFDKQISEKFPNGLKDKIDFSKLDDSAKEQFVKMLSNNDFVQALNKQLKANNGTEKFDVAGFMADHTDERGNFKQTEYIQADDKREQIVNDLVGKLKSVNDDERNAIKEYISSTNVPKILLEELAKGKNDFTLSKVENLDDLTEVLNMAQTNIREQGGPKDEHLTSMRYNKGTTEDENIKGFFDRMKKSPSTLADLDKQFKENFGASVDEVLSKQYADEYRAKNSGKKIDEKKLNEYVHKHVNNFKKEFPKIQEKRKEMYQHLEDQYNNFDKVFADMKKEDQAKILKKYGTNGQQPINKGKLYQDIITDLTGDDITMDRSKKVRKFSGQAANGTEDYSRQHFFGNDGELSKDGLKKLGFGMDRQINWGTVAKDAGLGLALGVASMMTFGVSEYALDVISNTVISRTNTTKTINNDTTNNIVTTINNDTTNNIVTTINNDTTNNIVTTINNDTTIINDINTIVEHTPELTQNGITIEGERYEIIGGDTTTTSFTDTTSSTETTSFTDTTSSTETTSFTDTTSSTETTSSTTTSEDVKTETSTEKKDPEKSSSKKKNYTRAAIGLATLPVLGAVNSIIRQMKDNNEVCFMNENRKEITDPDTLNKIDKVVGEFEKANGRALTVEEKRQVVTQVLCNRMNIDKNSNNGKLVDLISRFYVDENGDFHANAMLRDCNEAAGQNKQFSSDEAQAYIAHLMATGPIKATPGAKPPIKRPPVVPPKQDPTLGSNIGAQMFDDKLDALRYGNVDRTRALEHTGNKRYEGISGQVPLDQVTWQKTSEGKPDYEQAPIVFSVQDPRHNNTHKVVMLPLEVLQEAYPNYNAGDFTGQFYLSVSVTNSKGEEVKQDHDEVYRLEEFNSEFDEETNSYNIGTITLAQQEGDIGAGLGAVKGNSAHRGFIQNTRRPIRFEYDPETNTVKVKK